MKVNKDNTKDSLTVKEKRSNNAAVEGSPPACHSCKGWGREKTLRRLSNRTTPQHLVEGQGAQQ